MVLPLPHLNGRVCLGDQPDVERRKHDERDAKSSAEDRCKHELEATAEVAARLRNI